MIYDVWEFKPFEQPRLTRLECPQPPVGDPDTIVTDPDLSHVMGVPPTNWKLVGGQVRVKTKDECRAAGIRHYEPTHKEHDSRVKRIEKIYHFHHEELVENLRADLAEPLHKTIVKLAESELSDMKATQRTIREEFGEHRLFARLRHEGLAKQVDISAQHIKIVAISTVALAVALIVLTAKIHWS